ncbi:MAG: hypothetical protein HC899_19040 [Leptolyngbyaceae cyanobacterium SM1_4_3]|nr:hypothetical protein [Leptolyngbyaceae cyanobacterium SM1_4_3]
MSQRDSFFGGFLLGTVVGGVVGGILGAVVSSRLASDETSSEDFPKLKNKATRKRSLRTPTEQSIEAARRGLEDKIAELNEAIDDVRQQLNSTNGAPKSEGGRAIARE